jgi:predicted PolB exonuclease-like 3'-5' exonuclease
MSFAIFDIETRVDKQLLNRVFFAREKLDDETAYLRYRQGLHDRGGDFFPLTLHRPVSIAFGHVGDDHVLRSVESLALNHYSEETLCRDFWDRAERFDGCFVTFNGRLFDFPVMELQALRYGLSIPRYFSDGGPRRPLADCHLDLYDFLSNHGASRLTGGMNLLTKLIGLPGKGEVEGSQVQALFDADHLDQIHRYCRSDVIQTYFLFLRVQLIRTRLDPVSYNRVRDAGASFLDEFEAPTQSSGTA